MFNGVRNGIAATVSFCLILAGTAKAAQPATAAAEVQQLLEIGWKASPDSYTDAQDRYGRLRQAFRKDVRGPFAIALVALKNHNGQDAAKYFDEAVANGQTLFPIRRVKIWRDVVHKEKALAKTDIRELARLLSVDPAMADRLEYQETARWLGVVLGYYAGPGCTELGAADREALDVEISGMLKGSLAAALADGKSAVHVQFEKLVAELSDARQKIKEDKEAVLPEERQKNLDALAEATANRETAEQKLKQFEQSSDEFVTLKNKHDTLRQRIDALRQELNDRGGPDLPKNTGNKDKDDRADQEFKDSIARENRIRNELRSLGNTENAMFKQLDKLEGPLLYAIRKQQKLEQDYRKKLSQLAKPVAEDNAATTALAAKLKSFTTYAGIDLEQEKKRILESYAAAAPTADQRK